MNDTLVPAPPAPPLNWGWVARLVAGILLIVYSMVMFTAVEIPFIKIQPGSATDVLGLIDVEGAPTYDAEGHLLFLTVALSHRLTPLEALIASFDDEVELVEERRYTGDLTREELTRINLETMRRSELISIKVALEALGYEVGLLGKGAEVTAVVPDRPVAKYVREGDVVSAVDGRPTVFTQDVIRAVQDRRPGDTVVLTVERDGEEHTYEVETVKGEDGHAQVGLSLTDSVDFDFPVDVDIDTGQVGGPSAGLAFSLAVIDELTEGELTGGKVVAVTGQINTDGTVEEVGGVEQKAVAARRAGAVLMLVPRGEAPAARRFAGDMKVVAVSNLDDALAALAEIGGNGLALPLTLPLSSAPAG